MDTPDFKSHTLLIAEDNLQNFRFFALALKPTGIVICHAKTGSEAIALCKKHQPDLVLMDAMMPELSGFDATREIKKRYPAIPVIMLTAYATPASIREAVSAGCNDYLAKPVNKSLLYAYIQKWLIGTA